MIASEGPAALRHGEAVAIGLVFAARLAQSLGRIEADRVRRHEELVARYGLPGVLPSDADPKGLVALMRRDKKAYGDLTFVLDGPGGVEVVRGVAEASVLAVLEGLRD
jgi:5-deoxy-5-amino-3-dehydroquinate synthase